MARTRLRTTGLMFALAAALAVTPALAKKDDDKGNSGKSQGNSQQAEKVGSNHGKSGADHGKSAASDHGRNQGASGNSRGRKTVAKFDDDDRDVLRRYFRTEFDKGFCPPGLAKKHNGCMPPGQAKKWRIGNRLPPDVIFHDLPYWVLRELAQAPEGHKYVRVGADVLMLAIGTGMVVDALSDLSDL